MINIKNLSNVTMFVGLPGSGKTTMAAAISYECQKKGIPIWSNVPILGNYQYSWKTHFGNFDMSSGVCILDEAGLDVDNRSWEKNFDRNKVQFLKLIRHYGTKLVVFSQTWNDCDIKIRSMVGKLFICRQSLIPFVTVAIPVWRKIDVDEETHEFKEIYYKDSFIFRLFSCRRVFRPKYYKMFDSWDKPNLPSFKFNIYGKEDF